MALALTRRPLAERPRRSSQPFQLGMAMLLIVAVFGVAFVAPVPFWQARPAAPAPGQAPTAGLGWPAALVAIAFGVALCVPFRPYALALRAAGAVSTRLILGLTLILAATALLVYPAFGSDLFVYLDYERLWLVYGANPLLAFPALHPEDWAFSFVWIPQQPSPYGPLWAVLTWPLARLAGDSLWGYIGGYKLLSLMAYVTCCGLVWLTAARDHKQRALLLFAWSPLVLFEVLGKAHNDILLAASALAAVWLAARKQQPVLAMLAATAGALVKVSGAAIVLALVVWLIRQRRWRALAGGLAGSAGVGIVLYAPFWVGPSSLLPIFVQTSRVVWSPGSLLLVVASSLRVPTADGLIRVAMAAACAATFGLLARRRDSLPLLASGLLLATLLLMTTAFFAHYLVPVVALAAVAGNRRLERLALALSMGSLAAYAVELLSLAFGSEWNGSPAYQLLGSLLTLAPAALVFGRGAPSWWRAVGDRAAV